MWIRANGRKSGLCRGCWRKTDRAGYNAPRCCPRNNKFVELCRVFRGETMKRVGNIACCLLVALMFCGVSRTRAQEQKQDAAKQDGTKSDAAKQDTAKAADKKEEGEEDGNPFAPKPAPPLPPGMTGSDPNDPRAKLAPGLYDAGEVAVGMK